MSVVLLIENSYGSTDAVLFKNVDEAYAWEEANASVHVTGVVPLISKRDAKAVA